MRAFAHAGARAGGPAGMRRGTRGRAGVRARGRAGLLAGEYTCKCLEKIPSRADPYLPVVSSSGTMSRGLDE